MQTGQLELAEIAGIEDRYQIPLYAKRDAALVRGEGVFLWDTEGRRYLDMMSNYGVSILGHAHPAVTAAILEQADTLISCHQSFYNDARARFIEALQRLLPDGRQAGSRPRQAGRPTAPRWGSRPRQAGSRSLRRLSFANSGAEAVEAALKYARAATGRGRILSASRGYHGRTFGALSVTADQKHRAPFAPLLEGCEQVPYGDLEAAGNCLRDAAAIILEPVQGESGVRLAPAEYLAGLRRLCDQTGALLVFDEVQTAFRTGRTWAFEHSGAVPDIMALSKPLANGLPIGVTVVSEAVMEKIPPGSHGTTFGGNPLVCAAGAATLAVVAEPGFNQHVSEVGAHFLEGLRSIRHPLVREVRGLGLMVAVELKRKVTPVLQHMQHEGVLAIPAGSTTVRFLPPLIVERDHVQMAVEALERSLRSIGDDAR